MCTNNKFEIILSTFNCVFFFHYVLFREKKLKDGETIRGKPIQKQEINRHKLIPKSPFMASRLTKKFKFYE